MPGWQDWQAIPDSALQSEQQQDDANAWADKQRDLAAQQWGDAQRAAAPPLPLDTSGPGGWPAGGSAQDVAGVGGASTTPQAAPALGASPPTSAAPPATDQPIADTPVSQLAQPAERTSQFGLGLSSADAMAFCGPTAALAFAKTYGRNPTVDEAKQLAAAAGWTNQRGMAGVASEQALLNSMGVQAKLEWNVDWGHVAQDATGGNPVIISTPQHYYYVSGYDKDTGKFYVGTSGTDLRAGAAWMSPDQIQKISGQAQGALYADHPLAQGPSQAETQPIAKLPDNLGGAFSAIGQKAKDITTAVGDAVGPAVTDFAQNGPIGAANSALAGAGSAIKPYLPEDPAAAMADLTQKYGTSLPSDSMTPEDRARASNLIVAVGGMAGPVGGRPLFGRGGVPGGTGERPVMPAPTQPEDLTGALRQSIQQQYVKQMRGAGLSDDQIADAFRGQGVPDDQIQQALNPSAQPNVPTSTRPNPMDQGVQAIDRLNQGDESALKDLKQVDDLFNQPQTVNPSGQLEPGWTNLPGRQGGAVQNTGAPPGGRTPPPESPPLTDEGRSLLISQNGGVPPEVPPGGGGGPPPGGGEPPAPPTPQQPPPGPVRSTITPELWQQAHERIDQAIDIGQFPERNQAAHQQLDELIRSGADPGELARFMYGDVEGYQPGAASVLRTLRTGSMAGGLTSMGKVLISPVIQAAMRGSVGAVQAIVRGRPQDIPTGLQGGLAGLADSSVNALQQLRYGITDETALGGSSRFAGGGYGFAPGIDVMGQNPLTRAAGTGMLGLVRTHGASAELAAGMGRGANRALGATPEAAQEAGQQWALRSGQYGAIGQMVADSIEGIRRTNPAMDVVGQVLMPFYRVGYNAFTQGVERSPLGLGGRAIDFARGRPLDTGKLYNNMFGVGLAAYAYSQASQGNITGENPQGGAPQWSVRIPEQANLGPLEALAKRDGQGNLWIPLRDLPVAGESLAQAAMLYEGIRDGKSDVATTSQRVASSYVSHVLDDTWLRNISDIVDALKNVAGLNARSPRQEMYAQKGLANTGGNLARSFVPQGTLLSQGQRMFGSPSNGQSGQPSQQPVAPIRAGSSSQQQASPVPTPGANRNPFRKATPSPTP